jgi:hypothetical protein
MLSPFVAVDLSYRASVVDAPDPEPCLELLDPAA